MLRKINSNEYEDFKNEQIIRLSSVLRPSAFGAVQQCVPALVQAALPLGSNPHSAYDQILPSVLQQKSLCAPLLELYHSDEMKTLVKSITDWDAAHTLPLRTDGKFEINCKTNVYYSGRSYLGWHYDQTYNFKGNQVVVVLTLENNSAGPNLEYVPAKTSPSQTPTKTLHLPQNSVSVHNPDTIFHRVLPIEHANAGYQARRIVFVMRYTNDPTPVPYSMLNHAMFILKHPLKFWAVRDYKWICVCICSILLLIYICTEIKDLFLYLSADENASQCTSNLDAGRSAVPQVSARIDSPAVGAQCQVLDVGLGADHALGGKGL